MTQKEKLMKAFLAIQSINHYAKNIEDECTQYSSLAGRYARDIRSICDRILSILK